VKQEILEKYELVCWIIPKIEADDVYFEAVMSHSRRPAMPASHADQDKTYPVHHDPPPTAYASGKYLKRLCSSARKADTRSAQDSGLTGIPKQLDHC
jgi:hypothetical protein